MTYPAFDSNRLLESVRKGFSGPVTCVVCGCRLEQEVTGDAESWFHFSPRNGRDARGCRVECAEEAHDVFGYSLAAATA